jgi:catechol 2,3-dioxygenase-like lactoylglutathione lyase family enzyme
VPPPTAILTDMPVVAFVPTTDLGRSHAFYGAVLGLRRVEATSFANVYAAGTTRLRVTAVRRVAPAEYTVLGWQVGDLDAAIDALIARGVAFKQFGGLEQDAAGVWAAPGGSRVAWFDDPDGNTLSLQQPPADELHGPRDAPGLGQRADPSAAADDPSR